MKYIKQFTIIMTICLLGELLARTLPFTIPASVYGLFIMLLALITGIIKPKHVKETSDFLMDIMPIMFVPASVGLMVSWELLREILVPVLIVSVLGTLVVMIASGKTVDVLMTLTGKGTVLTDGITVDGVAIEGDMTDGECAENARIVELGGGDVADKPPNNVELGGGDVADKTPNDVEPGGGNVADKTPETKEIDGKMMDKTQLYGSQVENSDNPVGGSGNQVENSEQEGKK